MSGNALRAAIYTRVSTEGQAEEGYSLDSQERLARERCSREGWEVVGVYTDAGISGKDVQHRPAFQRLVQDAVQGQIDVIVFWALSRFTRSVADLYNTWADLGSDVALISLTEPFDTSTAMGRAMMGMLAVFAQMEREITAERVRAAMLERARQGKRTCNEVLGYDIVGRDQLRINAAEAERVRYIFDRYLEYKCLSAVAELCRLRGYAGKRGRAQKPESIKKILTRPVYAGYNVYKGTLYKGNHEAIVSPRTFNRVQRLLVRQGYKPRTPHCVPDK